MLGICVVGALSLLLNGITYSVTAVAAPGHEFTQNLVRFAITAEAITAASCVLFLLKFENAGEIKRSAETCYPIPAEVERRLRDGTSLTGLGNIPRVEGSTAHGTYCVRCLVWRPGKDQKPHHCNTCQRCVVGFDHHCGVFGRCIVNGNMVCFFTLIGMLFAGMCTAMIAVTTSQSGEMAGRTGPLEYHH
jgi:hypothetical protein